MVFFLHGLKMRIWFGYNPQVDFCHLSFCILNLVIFERDLFAQNWSDNNGKNYRLQDFYDSFDLHV